MESDTDGQADYSYWLKVRIWDSKEAAALLLGYEPDYAYGYGPDESGWVSDTIDPLRSAIRGKASKLETILRRAQLAGEFGKVQLNRIGDPWEKTVTWRKWVAWARLNNIKCSDVLSNATAELQEPYAADDLMEWLELDLWTRQEFACLSCDINPTGADIQWHGYQNAAGVTINRPRVINAQLLSEGPFFYITPTEQITQDEWDEVAFDLAARGAAVSSSQVQHNDEIEQKRLKLSAAEEKLQKIWLIICRANDLELEDHAMSSPKSYLVWAQRRGINIPWLEWAIQNNLVEPPKTEAVETNNVLEPIKPSDKRREEGLRAAIAILRQEHASGKLRARQDFEKCMRKVVVIEHIRENPADFPLCANIEPKNDRRLIKDREPTLTKDFPDFTQTKEIADEYERLIREK